MGHKVHLCDKGGVIGVYKQNPCAHLEFTPDKQHIRNRACRGWVTKLAPP
jgi:hypothetical protein